MSKPELDIIEELGAILTGEALERIKDELEDPGQGLTRGRMARVGAAFSALGSTLTKEAKNGLEGLQVHMEDEVVFQWRDPSSRTIVDSAVVKKTFPPSEYPELYKHSEAAGSVAVSLPFRTARD